MSLRDALPLPPCLMNCKLLPIARLYLFPGWTLQWGCCGRQVPLCYDQLFLPDFSLIGTLACLTPTGRSVSIPFGFDALPLPPISTILCLALSSATLSQSNAAASEAIYFPAPSRWAGKQTGCVLLPWFSAGLCRFELTSKKWMAQESLPVISLIQPWILLCGSKSLLLAGSKTIKCGTKLHLLFLLGEACDSSLSKWSPNNILHSLLAITVHCTLLTP